MIEPVVLTKENVLEHIIDCARVLENASFECEYIPLYIPKFRKRRVRIKKFNQRYPWFRGIGKDFSR